MGMGGPDMTKIWVVRKVFLPGGEDALSWVSGKPVWATFLKLIRAD